MKIIYTDLITNNAIMISPSGKPEDALKDVPQGATYIIVDESSLPDSRWFGAWRLNNNSVLIDLNKAKSQRVTELINELKLIRNQIQDALIDGDNATVLSLRQVVQKYKAAKVADMPNDLTLLSTWTPS